MEILFKERLRSLLDETDTPLSDIAYAVGVAEEVILRWAGGHGLPSYQQIFNLAFALGTTTDYLLGRNDRKKQ